MNRRSLRGAAVLATALLALVALSGCSRTGSNIPEPTGVAAETTETSVFYSTGRSLIEQKVVVDQKDVYAATLTELLKGEPTGSAQVAIVQPTAQVKSVTFKDGKVTVDWSADVLKFDATDKEKLLAWASILETMGQFPEVKTVMFTVEGKSDGTLGGKNVQDFWGKISLKKQPWDALRPPGFEKANGSAASSSTSGTK